MGFATSIGLLSVGQERRFVDYGALISGLIGLCSLVTAILVATVGLGLVSHGGGYRWAAVASPGLLVGLGVTIAVAGVGQRTPSPFIAATLVVAGAGPVPMLFWRGAGDHEHERPRSHVSRNASGSSRAHASEGNDDLLSALARGPRARSASPPAPTSPWPCDSAVALTRSPGDSLEGGAAGRPRSAGFERRAGRSGWVVEPKLPNVRVAPAGAA